jgi:flagellar hook-associated protein 1 FlgK
VQNQPLASGETPIDDYSNLVFNVGNMSAQAQASATAAQTNLQQLNNQLDSVSGVSIDEETANLIRYQNAYQAAARVISTVDNLTQDLFSMTSATG